MDALVGSVLFYLHKSVDCLSFSELLKLTGICLLFVPIILVNVFIRIYQNVANKPEMIGSYSSF